MTRASGCQTKRITVLGSRWFHHGDSMGERRGGRNGAPSLPVSFVLFCDGSIDRSIVFVQSKKPRSVLLYVNGDPLTR